MEGTETAQAVESPAAEPVTAPETVQAPESTSGVPEGLGAAMRAAQEASNSGEPKPAPDFEPEASPATEVPAAPAETPAPTPDTKPEVQAPAPVVEQPKETVPPVDPTASFNTMIADLTKGTVSDVARLKEVLADPVSLLPEHEQQLIKVARSGMDPMEYQRFQAQDFKAMEPLQMLKLDFLEKNKNIPADMADTLFQRMISRDYPNLEPFGEDDKESQVDQYLLKQKAETLASEYEAKQAEMRLIKPKEEKQADGPTQEQQDAAYAKHLSSIEQAIATETKLTYEVKVGDESKQIEVPLDKAADLKGPMDQTGDYLTARWTNPDGSFNYAKKLQDIALLESVPKLVKSAYEAGMNSKDSAILNELEVPEKIGSTASADTDPSPATIASAIGRAHRQAAGTYADY